jgi:beta-galactosidase
MAVTTSARPARTGRAITRIPHLLFGGDYSPEQWTEDVWTEDVALMRQAGVNLVSVGIFAWASIEPAEGRYEFDWLDRVLDLLHRGGVAANLATPTASPPPWLVRQHPEILPVTAEGVTLWHGSRRHYCPHSPAYRERAVAVTEALASHYRDHPALALWHIDNEYACHVTECFCPISAAAFREWLTDRYGSLERLNESWGTAFWSQIYGDWQEIEPPRRAPTFVNPGQQLDWLRFCSDSWLACFEDQRGVIRAATPDVPVTTNFMGFHKALDYRTLAAREHVVSVDSYPNTADPEWMVEAAMVCDLIRSLGDGRPWMLMEQATGHVNWRERNATKKPGVMRLGSYQAIARGAEATMFFQWRASKAGSEKFHSAMLPHAGTATRQWREVVHLGSELAGLDELLGSEVVTDVAILFDWENWWALELDGKPSAALRLMPQVRAFYREAFGRHVTLDFVHPAADLSGYRLVIAPALYLVEDASVDNITAWVRDGGTLVMSFFSGIVDGSDHVRLGEYPVPFRALLGLAVEEFAPHEEGQEGRIEIDDGRSFENRLWTDLIRLDGASAIATHGDGWYAGRAAITHHRFGNGSAFYLGTQPDAEGLRWLMDRAAEVAGVGGRTDLPADVEVVERTDGTRRWLFALNYSDRAVEVPLGGSGRALLAGRKVGGSVNVEPDDVAIIRLDA